MGRSAVSGKSLSHLLFHQVESHPDHHALVEGSHRCTYRQLWQRISRLRGFLAAQGISPGDRVLLFMDNSIHYVVAYYAVIHMGAVAVPLNTGLKGRQLSRIVAHAEASLLLHDDNARRESPTALASTVPTLSIADVQSRTVDHAETGAIAGAAAQGDELTTILYTSGTTGRPKGVMLSAGNLVANTLSIIDYLRLGREDRTLCVLPFYYAYGSSLLHTHLAAGATLILENSLMYPQRVLRRMVAEKVTGFAGVPSTYRLLLRRTDLPRYSLPHLRYLTQAGGAMSARDIGRIMGVWPGARFFVMYGQTEATARLTWLPPGRLHDKAGTVGIPVNGVRITIRDEAGVEKAPGETGEICASGPNIMLGYWRDPAASQAKFFGAWLRTGDLGFLDGEGYLTIVGRHGDMIKTGDHRVAPEEIEQVIAALDTVEEVAVVGAPDPVLGQVVKAFVVRTAGSVLQQRDIMRACKEQCAHYKIPRMIEFVTALPKTASGKIQRHKLLESVNPAEDCV